MEADTLDNVTILCRICFGVGDYNISSYQLQIEQEKFDLKTIFKDLSALETWDMENTPSMICNSCTDQLGQCYIFLQRLRNADEKIKQMFTSVNSDALSDSCESPGEASYEIIECLEEKDLDEDAKSASEEREYSPLEMNLDPPIPETEKKGTKRKISNKNAHFVLTENVTNILTNAQRLTSNDESSTSTQPPIKITKESNDGNCFLITKFVPTQPTIGPDTAPESSKDDLLVDPTAVNQVRMFDMAAVEVKASGKIELDEGDDETNIENPNTMYMCQYCPRAFATSHHLIMHQRKSHVCQFCMKGFNKVSDLHKHSKEAHNQFNCALCKKDFSSNSNLRQHMKRIHNVELPAHVSLLSFRKKEGST